MHSCRRRYCLISYVSVQVSQGQVTVCIPKVASCLEIGCQHLKTNYRDERLRMSFAACLAVAEWLGGTETVLA